MLTFRHAKMVREQSARDRILTKSENRVPVATIAAKPKSIAVPTITIDDPPKIRRVLPEHEGKYKIIQPSGTTSRSKEILAKRAQCKYSFLFICLAGSLTFSVS